MHKLRHVVQRLNLISASPGAPVLEVARRMAEGRIGCIPILEEDRLVGVFSERDLMVRVVVAGRDAASTPVSDVMTRDVVVAGLDDRIELCLDKMKSAGCRHLPVVADGRVISMLSMRDLLTEEIEEQTEEIRHLREYIHQA